MSESASASVSTIGFPSPFVADNLIVHVLKLRGSTGAVTWIPGSARGEVDGNNGEWSMIDKTSAHV